MEQAANRREQLVISGTIPPPVCSWARLAWEVSILVPNSLNTMLRTDRTVHILQYLSVILLKKYFPRLLLLISH